MKFDESNVINALHTDRAVIGSKGYFAHNIALLKEQVEKDDHYRFGTLTSICEHDNTHPFYCSNMYKYAYFYPEVEKKMVAYTWADRKMLRDKWIRSKETKREFKITDMYGISDGTLFINGTDARDFLDSYEFLDGKPFGKEM